MEMRLAVPNAMLLEDTMCHIRGNPELHNQSYFFEETEDGLTACFAGRACILSGLQPVMFVDTTGRALGSSVLMPNRFPGWWPGGRMSAWIAARDLLGIDAAWAQELFTPTNTRHMLELKVKDLLNSTKDNREFVSDRA